MYIKVRVKPKLEKEEIIRLKNDHYEIKIKEPAENNLANKRVLEIIRLLNPGKSVKIVSGHRSPNKILSIE